MTKKLIAALSFALISAWAWAVPTVDQVQAEVNRGNYTQAESMMHEVVQAKPGSAKAHYIYAELLAHNGNFSQAAQEARQAKQIDPDLKFTQPEKFRAFQQLLDREQNPTPTVAPRAQTAPAQFAPAPAPVRSERGGLPSWIWLVGLALVGWMLWRGFSRSRSMAGGTQLMPGPGTPGYGAPGYPAPGYGGPGGAAPYGYGPGMPQQGAGGSLLGTGLAVAGGVAAGMAVDEMLHRNRESSGFIPQSAPSNNSSGWLDAPGGGDNSAARDLEDRQVDFGNGGGWDSGGSGDSGGGGGGSSDDGGW